VTPGGRFEVYYTAGGGADGVDPTDEYGYGTPSWRSRTSGANGIPDYVDEVAYACDSAWSMEIDRFGFIEPYPTKTGSWTSDRYKVVLTDLAYDTYGMTYPSNRIAGRPLGFASHIELRNEWNGSRWNLGPTRNYAANPQLAAQITLAHEFFHAIQYAMSWNVQSGIFLDDFPVSWVEGTAVLMEDLGYDTVNDYLQYCGGYFNLPQLPVLNDQSGDYYKNSIIAMHLFQLVPPSPGIDFIKSMHDTNYAATADFNRNLDLASGASGKRWRDVLNDFHARSFFTGRRSREGAFIADAPLLPAWDFAIDIHQSALVDTKTVSAWGMQTFTLARKINQDDTLKVQFSGRHIASGKELYDGNWAVRLLLKPSGSRQFDLPLAMDVNANGSGTLTINGWSGYDTLLMVVSNAHPTYLGRAIVSFDTLLLDIPLTVPDAAFPNPAHLGGRAPGITFTGNGLRELVIYSQTGSAVHYTEFSGNTDRYVWDLTNAGHAAVTPGAYLALVRYNDGVSPKLRTRKHKLLIVP